MYEHLTCWGGGAPNAYHLALYSTWSRYDWGMIITGNVQVLGSHLTLGRDLVVPDQLDDTSLKLFENLAKASKGPDGQTLAIMQLSHAGRQSPNLLGGRYPFMPPSAPSSIPIGLRTTKHDFVAAVIQKLLFQTPKELTLAEIDDIAEKFVQGARLAHLSGFDGIELHAAHGCTYSRYRPSHIINGLSQTFWLSFSHPRYIDDSENNTIHLNLFSLSRTNVKINIRSNVKMGSVFSIRLLIEFEPLAPHDSSLVSS